MVKMELLSEVAVLRDLPAKGLVRGQVGTVVELLAPSVAEVEFSDDEGRTYAMAALRAEELIRLHHRPCERVAGEQREPPRPSELPDRGVDTCGARQP